jgi:hypothetical protein
VEAVTQWLPLVLLAYVIWRLRRHRRQALQARLEANATAQAGEASATATGGAIEVHLHFGAEFAQQVLSAGSMGRDAESAVVVERAGTPQQTMRPVGASEGASLARPVVVGPPVVHALTAWEANEFRPSPAQLVDERRKVPAVVGTCGECQATWPGVHAPWCAS